MLTVCPYRLRPSARQPTSAIYASIAQLFNLSRRKRGYIEKSEGGRHNVTIFSR
jgi:hypothetical protein